MSTESEQSVEEGPSLSLHELREAAAKENWAFVDEQLKSLPIPQHYLQWALDAGLGDEDRNIRDLAATLLNTSNLPLSKEDTAKLYTALEDRYHIVHTRVAIALWKRGNRDGIVEHILRKAVDEQDPDLGSLAEQTLQESTN